MKFTKLILLAMPVLMVVNYSCKKETPPANNNNTNTTITIDTSGKGKAIALYNKYYVPAEMTNFIWNGDTATCSPGSLTKTELDKVLLRINYYRSMINVPLMDWDNNFHKYAQKAALIMKANGKIDHFPDATWHCYSTDGYAAAAAGNLAQDPAGNPTTSIDQWIEDEGSNNAEVGHRRWILYAPGSTYAFGSTGDYSVLYWGSKSGPSGLTPYYTAWPPIGWVPQNVVYRRWSFSVINTTSDFSSATISITDKNGKTIGYSEKLATPKGAGDNSIVFVPDQSKINLSSAEDVIYHVTIANVKVNGKANTYNYDVKIYKP